MSGPALDLDEHEDLPPGSDNIDLALACPEVPGQDVPALQLEEGCGFGLSCLSD